MMIYGYGTKAKKVAYLGRRYCPNCGGFTNTYLYWKYTYYSFFFIPIIRNTKGHQIGCDICKLGRSVNYDTAQKIKEDFANFPNEEYIVKAIKDIRRWIHEEYTLLNREELVKSIEAYCHFEDEIEYLENLIDQLLVEEGRKDDGV